MHQISTQKVKSKGYVVDSRAICRH